jgi:hypothetical protein
MGFRRCARSTYSCCCRRLVCSSVKSSCRRPRVYVGVASNDMRRGLGPWEQEADFCSSLGNAFHWRCRLRCSSWAASACSYLASPVEESPWRCTCSRRCKSPLEECAHLGPRARLQEFLVHVPPVQSQWCSDAVQRGDSEAAPRPHRRVACCIISVACGVLSCVAAA